MTLNHWGRYFLLLVFLLLAATWLVGDSRHGGFDEQRIAEFKADPTFDYSQDYAQSDSLLAMFIAYVLTKIAQFFDATGAQWLLPNLFRLIVALLIIGALLIIARLRFGPALVRQPKGMKKGTVMPEEGDEVDYDALIDKSQREGNGRLVVRYIFLKTIVSLHQKELIKLADWKAPNDYARELPSELSRSFLSLTDTFESTWYGDYEATEQMVTNSFEWANTLGNA